MTITPSSCTVGVAPPVQSEQALTPHSGSEPLSTQVDGEPAAGSEATLSSGMKPLRRSFMKATWRRFDQHARPAQVAALTVLGLACYGVWVRSLPAPVTLTTVTATTERVEFVVSGRVPSIIPIGGMLFAGSDSLPTGMEGCLAGTLAPADGAVIAYERGIAGEIAVVLVSGKAVFEAAGDRGGRHYLEGFAEFVVHQKCCALEKAPTRFPLWGGLRLGDELPPTSASGHVRLGVLLEGRLKVQARSIAGIPQILFIGRPSLYPAAEMELPVGSRVEVAPDDRAANDWWGVAYVDNQKVALQVQAATDASELTVRRPRRQDPDIISVGALTQIFADPNLIRIQLFFVVLLAIAQFVGSFYQLRKPHVDR